MQFLLMKDGKSRVSVDVGVTPALRRRRERAERQRSFIREQQEATANMRASLGHTDDQESECSFNCYIFIVSIYFIFYLYFQLLHNNMIFVLTEKKFD